MKRLRGIVLLLLAGAILNVLVAWGCALLIDVEKTSANPVYSKVLEETYDQWGFYNWSSSFTYVYHIRTVNLQQRIGVRQYATSDNLHYTNSQRTVPDKETPALLPIWVRPDLMEHDSTGFHATGFGWPCITLTNETKRMNRAVWRLFTGKLVSYGPDVTGLELKKYPWPSGHPRVLPLRPAWPGFAANTMFYAVLLWLPFVARRMIRRRRGRCPACGYDLRKDLETGCPECGWGRLEEDREVCRAGSTGQSGP